jgi:hypothetical protein
MIPSKYNMHTINKNKLTNQLDQLAERVIARGVYVIDQRDQSIHIVDYLKNQTILNDIPTIDIANNICEQMNKLVKLKKVNLVQTQQLIDQCNRLTNEMMFYSNTINTTQDEFRRDVVSMRLGDAAHTRKQLVYQINKIFQYC